MGDVADAVIDGEACQECFAYIGDACGYARYCLGCQPKKSKIKQVQKYGLNQNKVKCAQCGKIVKDSGLADHNRVVHSSFRLDGGI